MIGIFPFGECVGPNGTFEELYQHIEYIASRWGLENVGLCSDIYPLPEYPFCEGYTDVTIWCGLKDYLASRLLDEEMQQICQQNWMRVFARAY